MLEKLFGNRNLSQIVKRYGQYIIFILSLILILGSDRLPEAVAQQTPTANYKTFTDWCVNKAKLKPEARRTVDQLLNLAGTNKCEAANQELSSLAGLGLFSDNQISDITPLKSLTKLTTLVLGDNPIANTTCPLKPESICQF